MVLQSAAPDRITVGPAGPSDGPAIRTLLRKAGLPTAGFADHLANFLVARRNGTIIGAAGFEWHGRAALLRSVAVAPAWRGAGLGGRLVRRVAATARRRRVSSFFLLTMSAEEFFATLGFKKVPREAVPAAIAGTPEFQRLCPASAVCLKRSTRTGI